MVAHYNKDKQINGIICDLCGKVYKDRFVYYSAKLDMVEVDREVGSKGIRDIDRRYLDLDICRTCFEKMKDRAKKVITERENRERQERVKKQNKPNNWTTKVHKQKMGPG